MRRPVLAALVASLLFGCATTGASSSGVSADQGAAPTSADKAQATDFSLRSTDGSMVRLSDFLGKDVVVLSFWATWCVPCNAEMPQLQKLHEKYKDQGLRVMSVSIDTEEDGQKQIEALIAKNKVSYPVLKDRFNLVARRWLGNKSPLPSVFLVKPDGTILAAHRGYSEDIAKVLEHEVLTELGLTAAADQP